MLKLLVTVEEAGALSAVLVAVREGTGGGIAMKMSSARSRWFSNRSPPYADTPLSLKLLQRCCLCASNSEHTYGWPQSRKYSSLDTAIVTWPSTSCMAPCAPIFALCELMNSLTSPRDFSRASGCLPFLTTEDSRCTSSSRNLSSSSQSSNGPTLTAGFVRSPLPSPGSSTVFPKQSWYLRETLRWFAVTPASSSSSTSSVRFWPKCSEPKFTGNELWYPMMRLILAPPWGSMYTLAWTPNEVERFAIQCTITVPTKPESGMNENEPLPSFEIDSSSGTSRSYPNPKVWITGCTPWARCSLFSRLGVIPRGGIRCSLGRPSVMKRIELTHSRRSAFSSVSMPRRSASHTLVQPLGWSAMTRWRMVSLLARVMYVRSCTSTALVEKEMTASRSVSFNISITVLSACFVMSRTENPTSILFPAWGTEAGSSMDWEMSMRATTSSGTGHLPSWGVILISTRVAASAVSLNVRMLSSAIRSDCSGTLDEPETPAARCRLNSSISFFSASFAFKSETSMLLELSTGDIPR
mmetsp:Transcript_21600/g.51239  ORF Transcript_21600/g.51239 Transcript_21600/m.51239 type:complete len:525 (+) Transcript_21600:839-2413(+)